MACAASPSKEEPDGSMCWQPEGCPLDTQCLRSPLVTNQAEAKTWTTYDRLGDSCDGFLPMAEKGADDGRVRR